jgi:hypothetical protein
MRLPKKTTDVVEKSTIVEEVRVEEDESLELPAKEKQPSASIQKTTLVNRESHNTNIQMSDISSTPMMEPGENLMKNTNDSWINNKWRPAMGWMYMVVCIFDFILFPILWAIVQFWEAMPENDAFRQWSPLTLQGAGLFHMAMGAVLGITAYGRSKEKIESKS